MAYVAPINYSWDDEFFTSPDVPTVYYSGGDEDDVAPRSLSVTPTNVNDYHSSPDTSVPTPLDGDQAQSDHLCHPA